MYDGSERVMSRPFSEEILVCLYGIRNNKFSAPRHAAADPTGPARKAKPRLGSRGKPAAKSHAT